MPSSSIDQKAHQLPIQVHPNHIFYCGKQQMIHRVVLILPRQPVSRVTLKVPFLYESTTKMKEKIDPQGLQCSSRGFFSWTPGYHHCFNEIKNLLSCPFRVHTNVFDSHALHRIPLVPGRKDIKFKPCFHHQHPHGPTLYCHSAQTASRQKRGSVVAPLENIMDRSLGPRSVGPTGRNKGRWSSIIFSFE